MSNQEKEIYLDAKIMHAGMMHAMLEQGGSIKFNGYPFGIRFVRNYERVEIQLFALPVDVTYKAQLNPGRVKVAKPKIETEEDEAIEL